MRIAVPDLVTNSYFPTLAAEEFRYYAVEGLHLGAAPGPDAALRRLLTDAGIDLARDGVRIASVPGSTLMRCPSWGFENPDGRKLCTECGAPLWMPCPHVSGWGRLHTYTVI